jgi:hypothetical protein
LCLNIAHRSPDSHRDVTNAPSAWLVILRGAGEHGLCLLISAQPEQNNVMHAEVQYLDRFDVARLVKHAAVDGGSIDFNVYSYTHSFWIQHLVAGT